MAVLAPSFTLSIEWQLLLSMLHPKKTKARAAFCRTGLGGARKESNGYGFETLAITTNNDSEFDST